MSVAHRVISLLRRTHVTLSPSRTSASVGQALPPLGYRAGHSGNRRRAGRSAKNRWSARVPPDESAGSTGEHSGGADPVEAHEPRVPGYVSRDYSGQPASDPAWIRFGHGTRSPFAGALCNEIACRATTPSIRRRGQAHP